MGSGHRRTAATIRATDISFDDSSYVRSVFAQIWDELPLLLAGALIVDLSAVPLVFLTYVGSVPLASLAAVLVVVPAWTAYCYMIGRSAVQFKPRFGDMVSAFVHTYWRSVLVCAPLAVLLPTVLLTSSWLIQDPPTIVVVGITVQAIAVLFFCALAIHALPLLACFDLSVRQAWSNGLILVLRWPMVAIGLLSMVFLLGLAARWLGLGVWLILPLLFAPFEVNATLMLTKRVMETS